MKQMYHGKTSRPGQYGWLGYWHYSLNWSLSKKKTMICLGFKFWGWSFFLSNVIMKDICNKFNDIQILNEVLTVGNDNQFIWLLKRLKGFWLRISVLLAFSYIDKVGAKRVWVRC